ncbi:MAG: prolyl oligopeptidase family serine peptidase [Planctomycetota bacterium]
MSKLMRIVLVAGLAILPACTTTPTSQPQAAAHEATKSSAMPAGRPTIEQFLKIRVPAGAALAADGTLYFRDWPDGIWQLYRVTPLAVSGGGRDYSPGKARIERLTDYKDGLGSFSLSRDGTKVLLSHAVGGNENFQISLMDTKTAKVTPVAANAKAQYAVNHWADDSSAFYFSGNDDSPNDFHLYKHTFATGKTTKVLGKEGSWSVEDATPDGSRLIVEKSNSASDANVFELDVKSGALVEITIKDEGKTAANSVVGYMPGNQQVMITSDYRDGNERIYIKDLKTQSVSSPLPSLNKFELDGVGFNHEKTMLAVATNEDGYGVPHVYTVDAFRSVDLPKIDRGIVGLGTFRGNSLVWSMNNAKTPGGAYVSTLGAGGTTTQLTFVESQGVDLSKFPLPELVKYKSFDGLEIPAFVFLPPGYDAAKPRPIPFICLYHGGPEGQHRPNFSAAQQYLLSRGFGIILPNVRGSTGYGRAFQMMDDYKGRWASVKDGVAAAKFLVDKGYATPGKITTYGGSYGGFMSVACLVEDTLNAEATKGKPYFGAGVDIVGIVNLQTFLEKTSGYRRKLREVEYGPLSDPDFLASVSSIKKLDKIKVPMFIAHGFNDPRVPIEEAMQLAVALKDRAAAEKNPALTPQLLVFPDEGHGFAKLENRLLFNKQSAAFLEQTIGK